MRRTGYVAILIIFCTSCRESYDPPVINSKASFLVVEANMDPVGATTILLTRTTGLDTRTGIKPENNAQVKVEGKDNTTRTLAFNGNGTYSSSGLGLIPNNEYRLHIRTIDGKEYLSDYVKARITPAIDSISWDQDKEGVHVYANTKDVTNNSRYYRWNYDETWEIHSLYFSSLIWEAGKVRDRVFPAENVSVCWRNNSSSTILLGNSARLENDIIYKAPLTLIAPGDDRLAVRYSILVRQYVLDREAYNFYELMKKNTEDVGSLFSAQPSEIKGNISCVSNPGEYVLGYVTASSVVERRKFIEIPWPIYQDCPEIKVPDNPDSLALYFGTGYLMPYSESSPPHVYYGSYPRCVDCKTRGGTTVRPSFW